MAIMMTPTIMHEDSGLTFDDLSAFPRILAVDPGTHTGWAVVWFDPDVVFDNKKKIIRATVAWQAGLALGSENNIADFLVRLHKRDDVGGEGLAVVHETFRVKAIRMQEEFLSPARISAKHEYAMHKGIREADGVVRRREPFWQEPTDALNVANDDQLRMWQMHLPGKDHPRDATRHALLWIRLLRAKGEEFYDHAHFVDEQLEDEEPNLVSLSL